MYSSAGVALMAVCSLLLVTSSGGHITIKVPSGSNSTSLESYLCGGWKLSSGTTLQLEAGEHVISGGHFCKISNLQHIIITGAGRALTIVRCIRTGRGFKFSSVKDLTISEMTFVGCGQVTMMHIPIAVDQIDDSIPPPVISPVVLFSEFSSVSIKHVTITNFSGLGMFGYVMDKAALKDVQFLNCVDCSGAVLQGVKILTVQGCLFANMSYHNSSNIASGLSIFNSNAEIIDCVFYNQSSERGAVFVVMSAASISNSTFVSLHGGALQLCYSHVIIDNSTFSGNFAGDNGGAINAYQNYYTIVRGCLFKDNVAPAWGGAISLHDSCPYQEHDHENLTMMISNCVLTNNAANVGGAIFVLNHCLSSEVMIIGTILQNNSAPIGAAIYAGHNHLGFQVDGFQVNVLLLHDLQVLENHCSSCVAEQDVVGAAVYYSEMDIVVVNGGRFVGNSPQGAIQGFSGDLLIAGDVLFSKNTGESGGAIYLMNNAHVSFHEDCNVLFEGNTASTFGGAIYIMGDLNMQKNPKLTLLRCAIQFTGERVNYSIIFTGNNAFVAGHSIYATPIYNCCLPLPEEIYEKYTMHSSAFYKQVFNFSHDSSALQILSLPQRLLLCSCNEAAQCRMIRNGVYDIATTPGRTVRITATSVDLDSNTSPAVVYTNVPTNSRNVSLAPQQNVQWIGKSCDTMQYQIYGQENTVIDIHLSTFKVNLQLSTLKGIPIILQITLKPCDPGFVLMTNSEGLLMCKCSSFLISYTVYCDLASGTVTRHDNMWLGVYYNGTRNVSALANTCPIDYCKLGFNNLSLLASNDLCDKNRQDLLCGHCHANLSVMFGSTECQVCSDLCMAPHHTLVWCTGYCSGSCPLCTQHNSDPGNHLWPHLLC